MAFTHMSLMVTLSMISNCGMWRSPAVGIDMSLVMCGYPLAQPCGRMRFVAAIRYLDTVRAVERPFSKMHT